MAVHVAKCMRERKKNNNFENKTINDADYLKQQHEILPQPMKLNDAPQYVAQNSNFSETGSYFTEKISSGFPSMSFDCSASAL